MEDQRLNDYFKFDEADLQANRNGQVTEKQQMRIKKDRRNNSLGISFFLFILAFTFFFLGVGRNPIDIIQTGAGVILGALGAYVFLRSRFRQSPLNLAVSKLEAPVRLEKFHASKGRNKTYFLHIGERSFVGVGDGLASSLTEGDVYCIYYLEPTRDPTPLDHILSVELISKAN